MNRLEAIKATKNGAIAACISGILTLAVFSIAIFTDAEGELQYWNDPYVIFDVLLVFACAYGIYKKSRFAAVLLFVYFIFAKIVIGIETGKFAGLWTAVVFLYFYAKAIRGTFVYHKIENAENPNYKATPKWFYFTAMPILIILVALIAIGFLTMIGTLPSTEVQPGSKMFKRDIELLISNAIISKDDQIEFFYSGGLTSILEQGSVLTSDRVILYLPDENQVLQVYEIFFDDIASVELVEKGSFLNDSVYKITSNKSGEWLQVTLPTENRGDNKFIEALRSKIVRSNLQ